MKKCVWLCVLPLMAGVVFAGDAGRIKIRAGAVYRSDMKISLSKALRWIENTVSEI